MTHKVGSCFPKVGHRIQPRGSPRPPKARGPSSEGAEPGRPGLTRCLVCLFPDQFQVVPLQFSRALDAHNPNTPEWREDVGLVVTRLLSKVPPAL